jgi:hypothetical protein
MKLRESSSLIMSSAAVISSINSSSNPSSMVFLYWCCIDDNEKSLKWIIEYIDCTIILHNLLTERKDEIPDDWMDLDDFSDIDDAGHAPGGYYDNVLNRQSQIMLPRTRGYVRSVAEETAKNLNPYPKIVASGKYFSSF